MFAAGMTGNAIARELGITPPTVSYYARKLGRPAMRAPRYDWTEVQAYYDAGHSITDCQLRFGFSRKTFYDACLRGEIRTRPQATPIADLLVAGRLRNRGNLKHRLISHGLKNDRCEDCGIAQWRGRPLSMALHHVNGDNLDNRLENLRLLCPNCHSQTDNFAGRGVALRRQAA